MKVLKYVGTEKYKLCKKAARKKYQHMPLDRLIEEYYNAAEKHGREGPTAQNTADCATLNRLIAWHKRERERREALRGKEPRIIIPVGGIIK